MDVEKKVNRIKEAIEHCKEICKSNINCSCKAEHVELAEWLQELLDAKYLDKDGNIIKQ